jgi:glutaminase
MRSMIPDYLAEVLHDCAADASGAVADYIPELARADPDQLAVALATVDGHVYAVGDHDVPFSIQSISKPFAYALALTDHGFDAVLAKVGVEPSGEAFNELSLESGTGRPLNPMINAGALTTYTLIGSVGLDDDERFERARGALSAFAGRELVVDEAVYASESQTSFRNRALAYILRAQDIVPDPDAAVAGYTRMCSLQVTARDLALMAATFANNGIQPLTGERLVGPDVVRQVLSVMTTCGMYDAAGDWVSTVGIPAKSGVSGGIIGALPGQLGVATFSPRLDAHGNSVRGVELCNRLSRDMGLHMMEVPPPARSVMRASRSIDLPEGRAARIYALQGVVTFTGAERVVSTVVAEDPWEDTVVLDLARVHTINDVARRMLLELVRRLAGDDRRVVLVDPEEVLPDPDAGDGVRPEVVQVLDGDPVGGA